MHHGTMDLDEWIATVPRALRNDPVWKVRAYQIGGYIAQLAADDAAIAAADIRFRENASQLVKAVGGITAAISEGYSRLSRKDRIRYYEYAHGSANESKSWYMGATCLFDAAMLDHRLEHLCRINQLLLVMIGNERKGQRWGGTRRIPPSETEPPRRALPPGRAPDS